MMQRVQILDGKFMAGGFPGLAYQVYRQNGEPLTMDYTGEAFVQGNTLNIGSAWATTITELRISDTPTQQSVDFAEGYDHGIRAKNNRRPSDRHSEAFVDGWRWARKEKKNAG